MFGPYFYNVVLGALSSFALYVFIEVESWLLYFKYLFSYCHATASVLCLFLTVPWVALRLRHFLVILVRFLKIF